MGESPTLKDAIQWEGERITTTKIQDGWDGCRCKEQ